NPQSAIRNPHCARRQVRVVQAAHGISENDRLCLDGVRFGVSANVEPPHGRLYFRNAVSQNLEKWRASHAPVAAILATDREPAITSLLDADWNMRTATWPA